MRFRRLTKWTDPAATADLVYLAQLLDELLFDYSLDTYKPSAMNTSLLCTEALHALEYAKSGVLSPQSVRHVLDELIDNLRRDDVAKSLLRLDLAQVLQTLKNDGTPESDLKLTLELLGDELNLRLYKHRNEQLLLEALRQRSGKDRIRSLTRSYVTTLRNLRYSSAHLQQSVQTFFYYGDNAITSIEDLVGFFGLFQGEPKVYVAIFRASTIFQEIADSCEELGVRVVASLDHFSAEVKRFSFELRNADEVYVVVDKLKARDVYVARELADRNIELMQTLMMLFHHKTSPTWSKECLVIDTATKDAKVVARSVNPMHKCLDYTPAKASRRLNFMISNLALHEDSFDKFTRSAELHGLALGSESRENQIINLWIALESLVPSSRERAKIDQVIDSIMPFITLAYTNRIMDRFLADMTRWNPGLVRKALREISGDSIRGKLATFLVAPEFESARTQMKDKMKDFHLLRNRMHYLSEALKTPRKIRKILTAHEQRVDWQIRRIYRARNMIVHAGITPTYTDILIENLHDYLDIVMSTVVKLASDADRIASIEQAFRYTKMSCDAYLASLDRDQDSLNSGDVDNVFFRYTI